MIGKVVTTGRISILGSDRGYHRLLRTIFCRKDSNPQPMFRCFQKLRSGSYRRHQPYGHLFKSENAFLTAAGNEVGISVENAFLYEQTRQAYEELKKTQGQLIQNDKLASLGKMSAVFAHEINNPILAILTYVKLIIKILKKPDLDIENRMDDLLRYLDTMKHETSRCGEIVQNLLTFARQSEPKLEGNSLEEYSIGPSPSYPMIWNSKANWSWMFTTICRPFGATSNRFSRSF